VFVDEFDKCVIRNTKSVGIMWRKCQVKRKILVEGADIVTWRSRYLNEVQEYRDNAHWMCYMDRQQLNISQNVGKKVKLWAFILTGTQETGLQCCM